eukprot:11214154-Ditylum_brightwellii.AAC.1
MGIAEQLIVDIPVDPQGTINVYIDNTIDITVDLPDTDNVTQLEQAMLLAIHVAARPVSTNEPLPRDEMASLSKLATEAQAEEENTILGWFFDFRTLTVALPENKHVA